ncbi:MAG TPA: glycosyl hydrolase family 28-related protein, partial [Planctomycetota bacterium]|nr:glycosyl hydrolase family 28-related protein [Planctomycetota bacterium]
WTSPAGAIQESGAPITVFDCVFTRPPSKEAPVRVDGDLRGGRVFLSNNKAEGCTEIVNFSTNEFRKANIFDVPVGTAGGVIKSAQQRFLRSKVRIPGKVFDAKRDFGAKGDGLTDDSEAIQKTIDAARAHGRDAIAYLPRGHYTVSQTLKLTGRDYFFGGCGYLSVLGWKKGVVGGTILAIENPQNLTVENISVSEEGNGFNATNDIDILQTGTGQPSSICYDRVQVYGIYKNKPLVKGLQLKNLGEGDVVNINEIEGNVRCIDSARATILLRLSYEGSIVVEGAKPERGGFIGGCVRLSTSADPGLWLKDNQSIVMSDCYTESGTQFIRMEGNAALPPGRVTIQGAKFEIANKENNAVDVSNYHGELFVGPYNYYVGNPLHRFVHRGDAPFLLTVWGGSFYNSKPEFKLGNTARLIVAGCRSPGDTVESSVKDVGTAQALPALARAFDDMRRLGEVEMKLNAE